MKPIPTIKEIFQRFEDKIKAELNIPVNEDLKENLSAIGMVISAELKLVYLYMQDIQRNVYPDTADYDGGLMRLGMIYLGRPPLPATNGVYTVSLSGSTGTTIPAGTTFKLIDAPDDDNRVYILDEDYVIVGGQNIMNIRSFESGSGNRLIIGDRLSYTSPIIGVNPIFIVVEEVVTPVDIESEEVYRRAIINAIQIEPQGGSRGDYILWSKDASGVRMVYPYVKNGEAGTVQIFVESPLDDSIDGKGTPSSNILDEVESVCLIDPDTSKPIEERSRKPIQAKLEVLPIDILDIDVTIHGLLRNSVDIQNNIFDNLENYLYNVRPFISGGQLNRDKNDILNTSRIANEINNSIGNDNYFNGITLLVNGISYQNYIFNFGKIPYLNSVSYD